MSSHDTVTMTFLRPMNEILDLLETTSPDHTPIRLRLKPDRRLRHEPPSGGVERRRQDRPS